MKKKFVAILKKIPWYHVVMYWVFGILFYQFAPNGVEFDDNAYGASMVGAATWILLDGIFTFAKRLLCDKYSPDQEVPGNV